MLETKNLLRPLNRICQACDMLLNHINFKTLIRLQVHSHGTIATAICLSQLIGCMEFNVTITIAPGEHLHLFLHKAFVAKIIFAIASFEQP